MFERFSLLRHIIKLHQRKVMAIELASKGTPMQYEDQGDAIFLTTQKLGGKHFF